MAGRPLRPPRVELAPGLEIPRVLTGLWQVADMERGGMPLDPDVAARALGEYAGAGFDAFDMADHYGSAELLVGRYLAGTRAGRGAPAAAFTKWCPMPGPHDAARSCATVSSNASTASACRASTCSSSTGGSTVTRVTSTRCASSTAIAAPGASGTSG